MFVRSQSQLAKDNPEATGQRLTRFQVEEAFGTDLVQRVLEQDVVSLVPSYREPAETIRRRRQQLGLELAQVAKSANLDVKIAEDAETAGKIVPIQDLNKLCQVLALDDTILGFNSTAGGDDKLGVRLRVMSETTDVHHFSPATVVSLLEAAWIISKQMRLSEFIDMPMHSFVAPSRARDGNYSYPTYEKGYLLAERTRHLLGLSPNAPIDSVRKLVEEVLRIPLIQVRLDPRFAGATIANGMYRGIVINETGHNSDVVIRRVTTCHELAHLLWDPDERLDRILVDEYAGIDGSSPSKDEVEMRANSFAIAFLAPRSAVNDIVNNSSSIGEAIHEVSSSFGIGIAAARYHVHNLANVETSSVSVADVDHSAWIAAENLTIDFLPGLEQSVPISRKGMFAGIVARAFLDGKISADTVGMCLKTPSSRISKDTAINIAAMWPSTNNEV